LEYQPTPINQIENELLEKRKIELFIKREDLNHTHVSGNKWWKLKYNLEEAMGAKCQGLLTFGGAYSNHLYATAAAANAIGLESIGIVRGEETLPLNSTLSFCKRNGMHLEYISREKYRLKNDPKFIASLRKQFGDFYFIPEGGTNTLAIKGVEEWAAIINKEADFDYLCVSVGTGGTMAGLINQLKSKTILGFSSLKGGNFLKQEIGQWVTSGLDNWKIETAYHFGGYGKVNEEQLGFIAEFEKTHHIPLDPIYTSKMVYGVLDRVKKNAFESGAKILMLHTGGLQGRAGFNF
jgi:1-aminocyclopropane-1-carboxylate deaminase